MHGVKATIIDLGLSRMNVDADGGQGVSPQYTEFDEVIFGGEGEIPILLRPRNDIHFKHNKGTTSLTFTE